MIILDSAKSYILRYDYTKKFVNTASAYYQENIERKTMFSDGLCYTGYLWDCLINPNVISEYEADQLLQEKTKIFIMWDIHSCERIFTSNYWKFSKAKVLCVDNWLDIKDNLPEDVYVFDDSFNWSIVYTHETDDKENRYCLFLGDN